MAGDRGGDQWGNGSARFCVAACHPEGRVDASVGSMAVVGLLAPRYFSGSMPRRSRARYERTTAPPRPSPRDRLRRVPRCRRARRAAVRTGRAVAGSVGSPVRRRSECCRGSRPRGLHPARAVPRTGFGTSRRPRPTCDPSCSTWRVTRNRRGLVSLRHHLPVDDRRASTEDEIELQEDQREVIEALRDLPHRQRTALVLRYYEELGIDDIAESMGISRNSVKTHLQRGLAALEQRLGDASDLAVVSESAR